MKRLMKVAMAVGFALGLVGSVQAASTDSITVTIRPNAAYSITIATLNVSLDLGTVDLSVATQTVRPATVTVQSTYATSDIRVRGQITSVAPTPWTFDASSASVNTDQLASWVTFTSVARSSAPTQTGDYFSGTAPGADDSDMLDAAERYAGTAGTADRLFEATGEFGAKVMDNQAPSDQSHMWLYFRMPGASTYGDAENVTIYLTALTPVP